MAHITSIGAGMYSDLAVTAPAADFSAATLAGLDAAAEFHALFATEVESAGGTKAANAFVRIKNVREFPAMGTPPNVVNVPVYGAKTSQQIQGQADSPSLEINLNFVASDWAKGNTPAAILGDMVGDGKQYVFRFALMNAAPTAAAGVATRFASTALGVGTVQNSMWYWIGKIEALQVTPQLTDANTAVITLTAQSEFYGAYTI
jgi:hypothetical protein